MRSEGVRVIKRHVKRGRDPKMPEGGIIEKAGSVAIANVMLVCPKCSTPTRVGRKLHHLGIPNDVQLSQWIQPWIRDGFDALEPLVAKYGQGYAFGDTPTIADCLLVPQVYSARRYEVDAYPTLLVLTLLFVAMRLLPGDPAVTLLGDHATPAQIEAMRSRLGLDVPLWQQYLRFLWSVLTLEPPE